MTQPLTEPERIDLSRADDPRDVVHRSVACLAQGGIVGLATETAYGLCASALQPDAVSRLRKLKGLDQASPLTLLLKGSNELSDWVPSVGELGRRLARRAWPGAVTLCFPTTLATGLARRLSPAVWPLIIADDRMALRIPAQPFIREVVRLLPGPLVMADGMRCDNDAPDTASALAEIPDYSLLVDEGPTRLAKPATFVHLDGERWRVVSPGAVSESTLTRMAGTIILFVCTGNTCRSPMAEALCKALLAKRLGCRLDELEQRGYVVLSAGMAAMNGMPAAANARDVVRQRGGSLETHASRRVTTELIRHADHVVAMTGDHLEALLDQVPEAASSTRLLHPEGGDVPDPVGSDRETYQRTAIAIEEYLVRFLDDIGIK